MELKIPHHRLKGIRLKVALLERGIAQNEASKLLGMRYSTFNMKLLGERNFTESEKAKLCAVLGKPQEELFPSDTDTQGEENTQELSASAR